MSARVYIHWVAGTWAVTADGIALLDKAPRVLLRDVAFVIDPVGIELSRARGKRKTHAWAVGERIRWDSEVDERDPVVFASLLWHPVTYRPREGDEHFGVLEVGGAKLHTLEGAEYLDADLERDRYTGTARISGPRYGLTERRKVQQYGGIR